MDSYLTEAFAFLHVSGLARHKCENKQFLIHRTASSVLGITCLNAWSFSIAPVIRTNSLKLNYSFAVPYSHGRTTYPTENACPKERGYLSQGSLPPNDYFYLRLQKELQQQAHLNSAQLSSSFYVGCTIDTIVAVPNILVPPVTLDRTMTQKTMSTLLLLKSFDLPCT